MIRIPIVVPMLMLSLAVLAQTENIILEGVVVDAGSLTSVPFSTIRLKNKHIGISASHDGTFPVVIPHSAAADTLVISSIGYTSFSVAIAELGTKSFHTIK